MSEEAGPRRWRRLAVASMVASLVVLVGLFVAVQVFFLRTAPGSPKECRRFRFDELRSVLGVELERPTVSERTEAGRLCHVEAENGPYWVTVNLDPLPRSAADYRRMWMAEGLTVNDVAGVGEDAVWRFHSDRRLLDLVASAGGRTVFVVVHAPSFTLETERRAAEHVARAGLSP